MEVVKFSDPFTTAKGETRASVQLKTLETLWFNTGTRCNLSCENCYIESHPKNDRLSFITKEDVKPYLDEIINNHLGTKEIGLTGGEPFLNPHIIEIIELSLEAGFRTLVLTNAFRLNRYKNDILRLSERFGDQFVMRVSLDHYTEKVHEEERGEGSFHPTMENVKWLYENSVKLAIAGRSLTDEDPKVVEAGYTQLLSEWGITLADQDRVIFPEMDPKGEVPEITTACWDILNKKPDQMMCASSRMVVKRKGEEQAKVLACTLLAYDKQFELGTSLENSKKEVQLNHPFCAQFCVLGGSSCS